MKSLAIFTLSAFASAAALALTSTPVISITGQLDQSTSVASGAQVHNTAQANATAMQNVSSNKGYVSIGGSRLEQSTWVNDSAQINNEAKQSGDIAVQNVSSNYGTKDDDVKFTSSSGSSYQRTTLSGNARLNNEADGAGSSSGCGNNDCLDGAQAVQNVSSNAGKVVIKASLKQTSSIDGGSVSNTAKGIDALAQQNLASNSSDVTVGGALTQTVSLKNTTVKNTANTTTTAVQNLASNAKDVDISSTVNQTVGMEGGNVTNAATGNRKTVAVQNLASNYDGVTVSDSLTQEVWGGGTVRNKADGAKAVAFQNLASNLGKVSVGGPTTQVVWANGSVVNTAKANAVAMQNLSSNDACEPPKLSALPDCPTGGCGWTVSRR